MRKWFDLHLLRSHQQLWKTIGSDNRMLHLRVNGTKIGSRYFGAEIFWSNTNKAEGREVGTRNICSIKGIGKLLPL